MSIHWKDWCWSWNSNTLATWCKELTHLKRPWCWERLKAGGERDDKGWDGWMASLTQWRWVWVNSGSWWWTGRPGVLWFMGSQRVGHNWATELNWTELNSVNFSLNLLPYPQYRKEIPTHEWHAQEELGNFQCFMFKDITVDFQPFQTVCILLI